MENKNQFLAFLLPLRCIIFLLVFVIGSAIVKKDVVAISNWWSIVATLTNIFTIIVLLVVAKTNKTNFGGLINYQKGKTTAKEAFLVILAILGLGFAGMYLAGLICYFKFPYMPTEMIEPIPLWMAIINLVALPITTAFAEEGLYLGCGVNQLKNKYVAIFVPAFFFALQHSFIPTRFDIIFILYRFLSFLPLTILLCWYYFKKRNPLPIMIGHTIIDVATVVQILLTSSGVLVLE